MILSPHLIVYIYDILYYQILYITVLRFIFYSITYDIL